jgi:hypothetical protein
MTLSRSGGLPFCLVLVSVGYLSACGATGGAGAPSTPMSVAGIGSNTVSGVSNMQVMVGGSEQKAIVRASREAVWAHLPAAYGWLGVPITDRDDSAFRLGNTQLKARRALNGLPLRSIVDCGSDLNGEKAETYDIRLTLETTVVSSGSPDVAEVTTMVTAVGRSPNFNNSEINCSTKGELERRILRYVRTQLGVTEK